MTKVIWSQSVVPGSVLIAAPATTSDPFWSNVVLLMGFEGTNGSTGAPGMTDESPAAHGTGTVTFDATISTAHAKAGLSSLALTTAGSNGKSVVQWPTSTDWNLGSSPFTIEFFYAGLGLRGSGAQIIFQGPNGNYQFYYGGLVLTFTATDGSSTVTLSEPVNIPDSSADWFYICVDFDGSKYRLYNNFSGSSGNPPPLATASMVSSSTSVITIATSATPIQFGSASATIFVNTCDCWIDEFRFTKGVARYATNGSFPVPTAPFPRHA